MPPPSSLPTVPLIVSRIDEALATFLDDRARTLEAAGPDLDDIVRSARELVFAGGKRIRPLFAYWGWRCVHADDAPGEAELITAAAGLELLHAAALVHDDLIDDSATRRGRPAAHAHFADRHRVAGWPGASGAFGAAVAILLGDLLLSWSATMVDGAGLDPARGRRARAVFDAMAAEMMAGQYLDVLDQARGRHSVESALRVARFKSAKYTVERPVQFGAAAGGASTAVLDALAGYGVPVGEAFQLRDDVLGVFGDPQTTGKPAGDDLREGKRTVLVALAHAAADPAGRALLDARLGDRDLDDAGISALRELIAGTGALAEVEAMIADRQARA
ncbi:MAG: polyprenyl synthetase family protein, partial [Actinomycetota bacterium]|nr:polyprenyl synthetase family protein [Actinomycetota bacterium]